MADSLLTRLPDFPPEARRAYQGLLSLELQVPSALERQVRRHLEELEHAHDRKEFADLERARRLARTSLQLLARWKGASQDEQRLIQAAVLYFVLDQDGVSDTRDPEGLVDDERVLEAVASYLESASL